MSNCVGPSESAKARQAVIRGGTSLFTRASCRNRRAINSERAVGRHGEPHLSAERPGYFRSVGTSATRLAIASSVMPYFSQIGLVISSSSLSARWNTDRVS